MHVAVPKSWSCVRYRILRRIEVFLLLSIVGVPCRAQNGDIRFEQISTEEGLSQSFVYSIVQDHTGYMWFGTRDGLNRYDGYTFTHYTHQPFDSTSLSSGVIRSICLAPSGDLWLGTYRGGVAYFDRSNERFVTVQKDPADTTSLSDDNVSTLYLDRTGTLWVGTILSGLNRLDRAAAVVSADGRTQNARFRRYISDPDDPTTVTQGNVSGICEDKSGNLWVATTWGLCMLNRATGKWERIYRLPAVTDKDNPGAINLMVRGKGGELLIGGVSGLFRFDPVRRTISLLYMTRSVSAIAVDTTGLIFFGSLEGLHELDPESGKHTLYSFRGDGRGLLSGDVVISLFIDRSGVLWVGTNAGICKSNRSASRFRTGLGYNAFDSALARMNVRTLYEDRSGALWIGTAGKGLFRFNRETGSITPFTPDRKYTNNGYINTIAEDRAGRIWVGRRSGVGLVDVEHSRILEYWAPSPIQMSGNVWGLCLDRFGSIWAGMVDGLVRIDTATGVVHHYRHDLRNPSTIGYDAAWVIHEDRSGEIWIGTPGGLERYDRATDGFIHYRHDPKDPSSLSHNEVWVIFEDHAGTLWIGTWGGGLDRFDPRTGQFRHYVEKDGLPSNTIQAIVEGADGNLWISTGQGISRFDSHSETFTNYSAADGLQSQEFNPNAACQIADGRLLFGGVGGINSFDPLRINAPSRFVPPVVITAFAKMGAMVSDRVKNGTWVEIAPGENYCSFEFAALDYGNPGRTRYAYMLEGFDPDWVASGNRRFASYTNLEPGEYLFRVKATNSDGVWHPPGVAIHVRVVPPFWKTRTFTLLSLMMLGAIGFLWYRGTLRKLRRREIALDVARENERRQIASELHDGPLQDLYSLRFALDRLAVTRRDDREAVDLTVMDDTLKKVRGDLRNVCGRLQLPSFDFGLDEAIRAHGARFNEIHPDLDVRFDLARDGNMLTYEQRENLFRIYRTAMNNVGRHAEARHVSVSLSREKKRIVMEIRDDGRGFVLETKRGDPMLDHYGLLLADAHAAAIDARLEVVSAPGKGTVVRAILRQRGRFLSRLSEWRSALVTSLRS